jgi:hypothetical protein
MLLELLLYLPFVSHSRLLYDIFYDPENYFLGLPTSLKVKGAPQFKHLVSVFSILGAKGTLQYAHTNGGLDCSKLLLRSSISAACVDVIEGAGPQPKPIVSTSRIVSNYQPPTTNAIQLVSPRNLDRQPPVL